METSKKYQSPRLLSTGGEHAFASDAFDVKCNRPAEGFLPTAEVYNYLQLLFPTQGLRMLENGKGSFCH